MPIVCAAWMWPLEVAYEQFSALHPDYNSAEASVYWLQATNFYSAALDTAECSPDALQATETALAEKKSKDFVETSFGLRPKVEEIETRHAQEVELCNQTGERLCLCSVNGARQSTYEAYYDGRMLRNGYYPAAPRGRYGGRFDRREGSIVGGRYEDYLERSAVECAPDQTPEPALPIEPVSQPAPNPFDWDGAFPDGVANEAIYEYCQSREVTNGHFDCACVAETAEAHRSEDETKRLNERIRMLDHALRSQQGRGDPDRLAKVEAERQKYVDALQSRDFSQLDDFSASEDALKREGYSAISCRDRRDAEILGASKCGSVENSTATGDRWATPTPFCECVGQKYAETFMNQDEGFQVRSARTVPMVTQAMAACR